MISLSSALPPLVRSLVQFTVAVYVVGAQPVAAAEELLLHVLSAGAPVSGASVVIDGVTRGRTLKDGSLLVDINGLGAHTLEGCYSATFDDPDNGAFWSLTVYDQNGFMFEDVAHMSSDIVTANADGTYTVNMGCRVDAENNLPISNDTGVSNFVVRHYIPSERVKFGGYRLMPLIQRVE